MNLKVSVTSTIGDVGSADEVLMANRMLNADAVMSRLIFFEFNS